MGCTSLYLVALWCAIKIVLFVRKNKNYFQDPKLQRQITLTLAFQVSIWCFLFKFQHVQALVPFIIVGFPSIVGTFATMLLRQKALGYTKVSFMFRMWVPLLNPIITLCFIRPYRRSIVMFFRGQSYVQSISGSRWTNVFYVLNFCWFKFACFRNFKDWFVNR
jgi:hypothetical protein